MREAHERYTASLSSQAAADENLRYATMGLKEGVIPVSNVIEAQTAWLKAKTNLIASDIDVRLAYLYLKKSLGTINNIHTAMKKKNINVIIVCTSIILAVIAIVVIVGLCIPEPEEVIQGQAETSDYRVSSKIPARILEIKVSEGDVVSKGDTLVILEAPDIQAKLAQAEAAFKAARAMEQKARTGARREQIQSALSGAFVGTLLVLECLPEDATAWNRAELQDVPLFKRWRCDKGGPGMGS